MVDDNLMPKHATFKDLSGQRFARWTVLRFEGMLDNRAHWLCKCDCGVTRTVLGKSLINGKSRSCGCLQREVCSKVQKTHGLTGTYMHVTWLKMIERCYCPSFNGWKNYGGRGISVCDRWRYSLENFANDMGPRPTNAHTLERCNNDLGYSPDNCIWATRMQQARNKRNNAMFTCNGKTQCLQDWANELGISASTLHSRIHKGMWDIDVALTTPKTRRSKHIIRNRQLRECQT